jgi:enoyl-CoA hydratase/carnithine racemase
MVFGCIIYEKEEGIATVKLNRPRVLNAINTLIR